MQTVRSLRLILNLQTLVVTALAVASTLACRTLEIRAEFPLTLMAIAIIFPIVFSIGGAYKRREAALDAYGSMKAHGRAMYFAARDWIDDPEPKLLEQLKAGLLELLLGCRELFAMPLSASRGRDHPEMVEREQRVYAAFSRLSLLIRGFRKTGLATGEVSRCNQYLSKTLAAFETVKHIHQYRTPRTLRAYSKLFIYVLPISYGPYFAAIAQDYSQGLEYLMPVLFAVVLVCLDNIQDHLENPFDQLGEDDIAINAEKFVAGLDA